VSGCFVPEYGAGGHWDTGDVLHVKIANPMQAGVDTYTWTTTAPTYGPDVAKQDISKIGVFPNPYYAFNPNEISRTTRFITFNRLPQTAIIRIFNLAGQLVRTLRKDDATQFMQWNLANEDNFPVASVCIWPMSNCPVLVRKFSRSQLSKSRKCQIISDEGNPKNEINLDVHKEIRYE